MKKHTCLNALTAAIALLSVTVHADPPAMTTAAESVAIASGLVTFPAGRQLVQTFTAATRAATAPVVAGQTGWETDTGLIYRATGTSAGNWTATLQAADADLTTWAGITPSANVQTLLGTFTKANLNAAVTDDNVAYVGTNNSFSVAQTIQSVRTGDQSDAAGVAVWHHNSLTGTANIALRQTSGGYTYLNAASGLEIFFGIGGGTLMSLQSTGLNFPNGSGIGFNGLAPLNCGLYPFANSDWIASGDLIYFRSGQNFGRQPMVVDTRSATNGVYFTARTQAERIYSGSYQIGGDTQTGALTFLGDSNTSGIYSGTTWMASLTVPTWNGKTLTQTTSATVGWTLKQMMEHSHTTVNPSYSQYGGLNILCIFGGTNDLVSESAQTAFGRLKELCLYYKRHGWLVIVGTCASRVDSGFDAKKNTFNSLLTAGWPHFADGLATLPSTIAADGAHANATYFTGDGIHFNAAGQAQVASAFDPVIDAVIASEGPVQYTDRDGGDITISNAGQTITIDASAVTSAKILDGTIADADLAGSITPSKITGTALTLSGGAMTGASSITLSGLGTTPTPALTIANSTAATNGSQQVSPSLVLRGFGFGTTAGTSQSVEFRHNILPVQGTTPTANYRLQYDLAGAGTWSTAFQVTSAGTITTTGGNSLTLGTDPRITQSSSGRPLELNTTAGTVNVFDTSTTGPRLALSKTASNTNPDWVLSYTAAARYGLGSGASSGWVDQYIGAAGGIVGLHSNASPSNHTIITNSTSTGTGASTGDIRFGTYGTNGSSGTAIGTVTIRARIAPNGEIFLNLPTSAGTTGSLWNDAGTVKVAP